VLDEGSRARWSPRIAERSFGLGPLEPLLADPEVDEVLVCGTAPAWVERAGGWRPPRSGSPRDGELRHAIERILAPLGRRVDEAEPLCDARLPDGSRVNVVIPPLALDGPVLTIRRFRRRGFTPDELVANGTLTARCRLPRARGARRATLLVCGGTGSGKTTTLNALSRFIAAASASSRSRTPPSCACASRTCPARGAAAEPRGPRRGHDPPARRNALRMRPDRIVVGEVRGPEALDMLTALSTGHDGSLCTVHAGSAAEALRRVETLALMADVGLPHAAIREQVADAIDLVVCQAARRRRHPPRRRVAEVVAGRRRRRRARASTAPDGGPRGARRSRRAGATLRSANEPPAAGRRRMTATAAGDRRGGAGGGRRRCGRARRVGGARDREAAGSPSGSSRGSRRSAARRGGAGAERGGAAAARLAGGRLAVSRRLAARRPAARLLAAWPARRRSSRWCGARRARYRAELRAARPARPGARRRDRAGHSVRGALADVAPARAGRRRHELRLAARRSRSASRPRRCSSACGRARHAGVGRRSSPRILLQRDAGGDLPRCCASSPPRSRPATARSATPARPPPRRASPPGSSSRSRSERRRSRRSPRPASSARSSPAPLPAALTALALVLQAPASSRSTGSSGPRGRDRRHGPCGRRRSGGGSRCHGPRKGLDAPAPPAAPPAGPDAAGERRHRLAARAPRDLGARLEAAGLDTPPGDVMAAKTGAALSHCWPRSRSPPRSRR
jgi:pilus assembly protein CpaF